MLNLFNCSKINGLNIDVFTRPDVAVADHVHIETRDMDGDVFVGIVDLANEDHNIQYLIVARGFGFCKVQTNYIEKIFLTSDEAESYIEDHHLNKDMVLARSFGVMFNMTQEYFNKKDEELFAFLEG